MKKFDDIDCHIEYELLDEKQQDADLREKLIYLYSSVFSDILWWELHFTSLTKNGCYKLFYYEHSELKHIILFTYSPKDSKKIVVLNKQFSISSEHLQNICQILFNEFNKVQQIVFEKIFDYNIQKAPKMAFEISWDNDIVIPDLPETMDAYMKSLGKRTRKKINLMSSRIEKDFPDFKVHFFEKNDISYERIENVILMNRRRMCAKGGKSIFDDNECHTLYEYTSASFGFLCICEINGKDVGGMIISVIGEHAYGHVLSHDEAYNEYSIGQITLAQATKYLIEEKKVKHFHLGDGDQEYKYRHGGVNHKSYIIRVFRNNNIYFFFWKMVCALKDIHRKIERKYKIEYRLSVISNKFKRKIHIE